MTGIAGGAIVQILIGAISDFTSLKVGMIFIFITLGYIFSIGIWAKPLVRNKTFGKDGSQIPIAIGTEVGR